MQEHCKVPPYHTDFDNIRSKHAQFTSCSDPLLSECPYDCLMPSFMHILPQIMVELEAPTSLKMPNTSRNTSRAKPLVKLILFMIFVNYWHIRHVMQIVTIHVK